ncbi:MAG: hypothetical protein ACI4B3_04165 [Prevotella sp.]
MKHNESNAFTGFGFNPDSGDVRQNATQSDFDTMSMEDQEKERYGQDTRFRKYLTYWVMIIVPVWLMSVIVIVFFCAFGLCELTDVQMSTLLATTTANVLGLAYIVLKGMFGVKNKK